MFDSKIEHICDNAYSEMKGMYHLCTPENFELIFTNEDELKMGVCLLGLCARAFPMIHIYTFQLMSNHIHIALSGNTEDIDDFFKLFSSMLRKMFDKIGRFIHWPEWRHKLVPVTSLENARNVIAYINRNGSIVRPDATPWSYPWGANRFYFNPEVQSRHRENWSQVSLRNRQFLSHSRKFDTVDGIFKIDGYVSPLCFCDIADGERLFRDARHYFSKISRNVEAYKDIAQSIGESLFYTDDDLFLVAVRKASLKYGIQKLSLLPKDPKIELARELHSEYNAGNKQIQRLLKIDENILKSLFPK